MKTVLLCIMFLAIPGLGVQAQVPYLVYYDIPWFTSQQNVQKLLEEHGLKDILTRQIDEGSEMIVRVAAEELEEYTVLVFNRNSELITVTSSITCINENPDNVLQMLRKHIAGKYGKEAQASPLERYYSWDLENESIAVSLLSEKVVGVSSFSKPQSKPSQPEQ